MTSGGTPAELPWIPVRPPVETASLARDILRPSAVGRVSWMRLDWFCGSRAVLIPRLEAIYSCVMETVSGHVIRCVGPDGRYSGIAVSQKMAAFVHSGA